MKITKKEKTALGKVAMEMLADRITGVEKGQNLTDVLPRRSITIKLDAELADMIDGYAKRAKTTRTEVVETMLWYGVEAMNNLDGTTVEEFQRELALDLVNISETEKAKKAVKK